MSEITEQEATRIMSHMNKDHQESLGHYLEYFGRITPSSLAYLSPQITQFTSNQMSIEYGPSSKRQTWEYKFMPEMGPGQARQRLEKMHREAKEGLGISEITLNDFTLPPMAYFSILLCLSLDLWLLLTPSPTISHYLRWQKPLFSPLLQLFSIYATPQSLGTTMKLFWLGLLNGAHFVEIFVCLNPVLKRYNVKNPFVKFLYTITTQIGGFPIWTSIKERGIREESKLNKKE